MALVYFSFPLKNKFFTCGKYYLLKCFTLMKNSLWRIKILLSIFFLKGFIYFITTHYNICLTPWFRSDWRHPDNNGNFKSFPNGQHLWTFMVELSFSLGQVNTLPATESTQNVDGMGSGSGYTSSWTSFP